ncbi:DUF2207 domain-containing protein [Pseudomonas sp. NCCP-436]|uniref:DUF2207 domain-containing protein n=1 Tax=Pseudomonas sp. NCCP-436 TaxID=2842481 RepID=UPI001C80AA85|nr:DUF2207 domain-containing protein [Pseudomonas sp. NCCP-436]GIZ10763.1 hypothetical protein NCCP436_01790 [Pseudomonas sp. NCCP-436]
MTLCLRVLLLCWLLPLAALAQERIEDFSVRLQIEEDGSLLVTERIRVRAAGQEIRRGIYRDLPVRYQLPSGLTQSSPLSLLEITRNGSEEPVRSEHNGAWQRFYIGTPEVLLEPGRHTYVLRYRVERALLHHPDSDELYWNVTGNGWVFPIRRAMVEVRLPQGGRITDWAAYTGAEGEQGEDFELLEQGNDYLRLATTGTLPAHHGLTVAVGWPAGLVPRPDVRQEAVWLLHDNLGLVLGALALLGVLAFYLLAWRLVGRDPQKGLIIPLFQGPEGMTPLQAGYLWHRGLRGGFAPSRAFSVWLTDMAIRRQLALEDKSKGGFLLSRRRSAGQLSDELDRELCRHLFGQSGGSGSLHLDRRYEPRLAAALGELASRLKVQGMVWFSNNRGLWSLGLLLAVAGCTAMLLLDSHGDEEMEWVAGLALIFGFGLPALLLLGQLRHEVGLWRRIRRGGLALLLTAPALLGVLLLGQSLALPMLILLMLHGAVVVLFYYLMPAPTVQGRRLLDALEGYYNYLQLAERDVLALADKAPAMSIALYERHLPYAMALGVEDKWSARFAAALASGLIDPQQRDYQPAWYRGHERYSSPQALSSALTAGLGSATALASTPPSSSSSGGGLSGGGSSGGGGGGGGGGGW